MKKSVVWGSKAEKVLKILSVSFNSKKVNYLLHRGHGPKQSEFYDGLFIVKLFV